MYLYLYTGQLRNGVLFLFAGDIKIAGPSDHRNFVPPGGLLPRLIRSEKISRYGGMRRDDPLKLAFLIPYSW